MRLRALQIILAGAVLALPTMSRPSEPLTADMLQARLQTICANNCMAPAALRAHVRATAQDAPVDAAVVMRVRYLMRDDGYFELHNYNVYSPDCVIIEISRDVLFDLLNPPVDDDLVQPESGDGQDIVVLGRSDRDTIRPTERNLRRLLEGKSIVVRGRARLQRHRRPLFGLLGGEEGDQIFLRPESAADVALIPIGSEPRVLSRTPTPTRRKP